MFEHERMAAALLAQAADSPHLGQRQVLISEALVHAVMHVGELLTYNNDPSVRSNEESALDGVRGDQYRSDPVGRAAA